jgi:hypothetical protein
MKDREIKQNDDKRRTETENRMRNGETKTKQKQRLEVDSGERRNQQYKKH